MNKIFEQPLPNIRRFILGLVFCVSLQSAKGVVIGFEGTGVAPNGVISPVPLPYTESGFRLRNGVPAAESGIFGANTGGVPNSGSDFLGWHFNGVIILEAVGGAPFTLNSFDAGHIGPQGGLPAVLPLEVTGHLAGGGMVVTVINYSVAWSTFALPATFTGLSSVEFFTSMDGGGGIDNIVINEGTGRVPDGGSTWLMACIAMFALACTNRRRAWRA